MGMRMRSNPPSKRTRQLGRGSPEDRDKTGRVDDGSTTRTTHGWNGVLAAPPHALDVDVHGTIPDTFLGGFRVVVVWLWLDDNKR